MITRSEMDFTYLLCKISQVFEITRGTALFSCETTTKLIGGEVGGLPKARPQQYFSELTICKLHFVWKKWF